jgi:putative oxidoreductase
VTSHSDDPHTWQRPDDSAAPKPLRPGSASLVDPEDDLPSANYAGDLTTTAIPRYTPGSQHHDSPRIGLLGEREPLPYVQPGTPGRHAAAGHEEVEREELIDERVRAASRRGTQDLGLLVLRLGVATVLIAHGLQKAFGWWGGVGPTGFKNSLSDMGYRHADILTYVAPGTQVAAGVLLVLGLLTPLAAAGAIAYVTNALLATVATAHATGHMWFFLPDGIEYQALLIAALAAITLVGPGRYGFDAGRGWARRPFIGSFALLLLGIGGGVAGWIFLNGANPLG